MKKKLYAVLLVLVSIIACAICLTACKEKKSRPAEYVGSYVCVGGTVIHKYDDEFEEIKEPFLDEGDFVGLKLKDDGKSSFVIATLGEAPLVAKGTWSISDGQLMFTYNAGSESSLSTEGLSCSLIGDTLTLKAETKIDGLVDNKVEMIFKRGEFEEDLGGDGSDPARLAKYVGNYKCTAGKYVEYIDGEEKITTLENPERCTLELKDDGTYIQSVTDGDKKIVDQSGTWTASYGLIKFRMEYEGLEAYGGSGTLTNDTLVVKYEIEYGIGEYRSSEFTYKKVAASA